MGKVWPLEYQNGLALHESTTDFEHRESCQTERPLECVRPVVIAQVHGSAGLSDE